MESDDSLPCSQESSTGPYPEADQFSPYRPVPHVPNLMPNFLNLGRSSKEQASVQSLV
jgi:hypothetical protein